jgi:hypothetical protein
MLLRECDAALLRQPLAGLQRGWLLADLPGRAGANGRLTKE